VEVPRSINEPKIIIIHCNFFQCFKVISSIYVQYCNNLKHSCWQMKVRRVQNLFPFYALCCLLLTLLTAPGKKVWIYSFSVLYKSCNLVLRENNESKMDQLQQTNMKQIASTKHLNLSAGEGYKCTSSSIVRNRNTVFSNSNLETKKWTFIFLLWKIFSFYICTFATGSVCPLTLPLGILWSMGILWNHI